MAAAAAIAGAITGFLVERTGYAAFFALSIVAGAPGMLLIPLLPARRRTRSCRQCGYDLLGSAASVCPECSAPVERCT